MIQKGGDTKEKQIKIEALGVQSKNLFVRDSSVQTCSGHKQEVRHNKKIYLFIHTKAFTSMDLLLLRIQYILSKWKLE